jgi:hypothetical protein
MSTLNDPDWGWYVGYTDELYSSGPHATRDEAVYIAKEEFEGGYIVEAYKRPIDLASFFEIRSFLEDFEDNNYEFGNEDGDPIIDITPAQQKELEDMVRQAINNWQTRNGLVFLPWAFTQTRNEEYINGEVDDPGLPVSEESQGA